MTKKFFLTGLCFAIAVFVGAFFGGMLVPQKVSAATQSDFYWSVRNKPVFYGATKITVSKNAVEEFDILDPRFRVFAHDFEDGDLKVVCTKQDVKISEPGTYTISYKATDSHKNVSTLDVSVIVEDNLEHMIDVERTAYTIPNDWNMTQVGFSRCNNGDRQILGIYLPEGASFDVKNLTQNRTISIALLNNDGQTESSKNIPYSQEFVTMKNVISDVEYESVPLLSSIKLARGEDISTTFKYEIRYDAQEVDPLVYHYYGEDEDAFYETFRASGDKLAVIESQELVILMPIGDINAPTRYDFSSIKEFLEYYAKVIKKMDEIVGLDFRPQKATDQNLRAKYLVKANRHGAGGAYYAGNHIAVSTASMGSFFEMNWGGLHELAHGYQGYLGNGTLGLGEVSNNILGHYIQMSDIYSSSKSTNASKGKWLGKLENSEVSRNKTRIDNDWGFADFGGNNIGTRLYALINLFDAFEGEKTYAKMFSYLREKVNDGTYNTSMPQQDFYALFFVDEYQTDILPYFHQWKIEVSDEVKEEVFNHSTKHLSILADSALDKTDEILQEENLSLRYGLVSDEILAKHNVTSNLDVLFEIEDIAILNGKSVLLEKDGQIVAQQKVKDGKAQMQGLEAGTYVLRLPVLADHESSFEFVTLEAGDNTFTYAYTLSDKDFHPTKLRISGPNKTDGYNLILSNHNKTGTIKLGLADLGNQGSYWKQHSEEVYVSVTIKDRSGKVIDQQVVLGAEYFTRESVADINVSLDYGYTIDIFTNSPQYVQVWSLVTNQIISDYESSEKNLQFEVTEKGLIPKYIQDFDLEGVLYESIKDTLLDDLTQLEEYFHQNPDQLQAKYLSTKKKNDFVKSYEGLKKDDRSQFDSLYADIVAGGKPQIKILKNNETFALGEEIKFYEMISAFDKEDGQMTLSEDNVKLAKDTDFSKTGKYEVEVLVFDSDGNFSSCTITVNVTMNVALIVGICVPCAIVLIWIVFAIVFVIYSKKKKRKKKVANKKPVAKAK